MDKVVLAYQYSQDLGRKLARALGAKFSIIKIKQFPDGEKLVQILADVKNKKVIVVSSLYNPDEKIIDLCLTADTLKDLGAAQRILVAPYLCYMRQDKRFHKGESISSKTIARLISPSFEKLITVDPHLHRYKSLHIIYRLKTMALTANPLLADYIKKNFKSGDVVIIGPDAESYQWAESVAKRVGAQVTVCKKIRFSSRHVKIALATKIKLKKKHIFIVDDIISTGHTMLEIVKLVKKHNPASVSCIGVHGLFVENAYNKLKKAGAGVITTNTIPHKTNRIDITQLLKKEIN